MVVCADSKTIGSSSRWVDIGLGILLRVQPHAQQFQIRPSMNRSQDGSHQRVTNTRPLITDSETYTYHHTLNSNHVSAPVPLALCMNLGPNHGQALGPSGMAWVLYTRLQGFI